MIIMNRFTTTRRIPYSEALHHTEIKNEGSLGSFSLPEEKWERLYYKRRDVKRPSHRKWRTLLPEVRHYSSHLTGSEEPFYRKCAITAPISQEVKNSSTGSAPLQRPSHRKWRTLLPEVRQRVLHFLWDGSCNGALPVEEFFTSCEMGAVMAHFR